MRQKTNLVTFAVLVVKRSGLENVKSTLFSHKLKHFVFLTKLNLNWRGGWGEAYEGDTFSHSKDTSLHSAELRQEDTNPKLEWQTTSQSESS